MIDRQVRAACAGVLLFCLALANAPAGPDIPELNWVKRSDWLDVTTDVEPPALGDGVADDTDALQAALDSMQHGSTVFLPAGTYRITRTLVMKSQASGRLLGTSIIGCGRLTRIVWDGAEDPDAAMLWIKTGAAHTARYVGLAWDGRGRAGIGIDHRSDAFESVVAHQHQAFRDFTDSGIRVGRGVYQSAEMRFENCLFERCAHGLSFLQFNDYNNTVDGCEFRDCGIGVIDRHGNTYVRNSRFSGSATVDLRIHSEHGSSVRRCTSEGSRAFLHFTAYVAPLTLQQCHVSGWTDPDGPIRFGNDLAPVILLDNVFSAPPNDLAPVPVPSGPLVVSGNTAQGGGAVLRGRRDSVTEIPAGTVQAPELPAGRSFLKDRAALPSRIFDAKTDFGAAGDGRTDDTDAVQNAIDAAREHGQDAIAYLPRGDYAVSRTLRLGGADYRVGGSGSRTYIRWRGRGPEPVFHVEDPQRVILEQLAVVSEGTGPDVLQTDSGQPSFMVYDSVYVYGMYRRNPWKHGLHLVGLGQGATVLIREITGSMRFTNSAEARILVNASYYGNVMVDGKDKRRSGILGFLSRFSGEKPCTLYVWDNQNLVMSDYYVESAEQYASIRGSADDPPGRVVIQGAKIHCKGYPLSPVPIAIQDYAGLIMLGHQQFNNSPKPSLIAWGGKRPCDLILVGAEWYGTTPAIQRVGETDPETSVLRAYAVGCEVKSWNRETDRPLSHRFEEVFNPLEADALAGVASGFDELRRLGQLDLELNHSETGRETD